MQIQELLSLLRKRSGLVHCITNVVTVESCAEIALAAGARPTMAHAPQEAAAVTGAADALVLNLGATESFDAMLLSLEAAREKRIPVVLDPVGTAGSPFRRDFASSLRPAPTPFVIRGNAGEIHALLSGHDTGAGVDSTGPQPPAGEMARALARAAGAVVIVSGQEDVLSDGEEVVTVSGGSRMFRRVTGAGCMCSVFLGACLAAARAEKGSELSIREAFDICEAACRLYKSCGEEAEKKTRAAGAGTMTFRLQLIDALSLLTEPEA